MGWSIAGDREKFTLQEMIEAFTFESHQPGWPGLRPGQVVGGECRIYLRALDDDGIVARLRDWRSRMILAIVGTSRAQADPTAAGRVVP